MKKKHDTRVAKYHKKSIKKNKKTIKKSSIPSYSGKHKSKSTSWIFLENSELVTKVTTTETWTRYSELTREEKRFKKQGSLNISARVGEAGRETKERGDNWP